MYQPHRIRGRGYAAGLSRSPARAVSSRPMSMDAWDSERIGAVAGDEVHLWTVRLPLGEEWAARCARALSSEERDRVGVLPPDRRARFVAVRGVLRSVLGGYLGCEAAEVRLRYREHGKPELDGEQGASGLRFNLTHAGELALLAVARDREVGVDVEPVREVARLERIAARLMDPAELADWVRLPDQGRRHDFFRRWTRLEAIAKLRGDGVWRTLIQGGHRDPAGRSLWELEPEPGYQAAVAAEGEDARLVGREWGYQR